MLDHGPGDRQAVEGRRAPPDLIQDHQRPVRRLIEDAGRLDHLDHERRASPRQIVGRADAGEQPVDDADMRGFRRHVGAHLRHHGDQRVLAQERRFARHVRAGHQPDARILAGRETRRVRLRASQHAIVLDEGATACFLQGLLDDRMAATADLEGGAIVEDGPHVALLLGQFRQARNSGRPRPVPWRDRRAGPRPWQWPPPARRKSGSRFRRPSPPPT